MVRHQAVKYELPPFFARNQTSIFQHGQMLGHGWFGHGEPGRDFPGIQFGMR